MKPLRLMAILEASTLTGPAKNLLQFAQDARSGHPPVEVAAVVFRSGAAPSLFMQKAGECSVPVYPVMQSGRLDRAVLAKLQSLAKEFQPDLIQSHAVKSHFLVRASGLHRMAPWVAFHHGYTWPDLRMRLYNQLDRWSLRAARQVLTVSRPFRDELVRRGVSPDRIEIVHNAIDPRWGCRDAGPERAATLRKALGIRPEKRVILIVGRLSREKDHRTLLNALDRLRRDGLDPHLLIVGDGPERTRITQTIRALDLAADVTLAGQVSSAEPYYAIADVAVLSSLSEGSPNALLEAMAARVPVVATAVGGIPEIVAHGDSALLIQPEDPAAMAGAIAALLRDAALGRGLADRARDLIESQHAPDSRARRLVEIYMRVVT